MRYLVLRYLANTINGIIISDKDNPKFYCHIFPFKNSFSYENCTFQTFKSNHYTTLYH
ncbi:hypothetical protein VN1338_12430 [Helicobacter pylori]